MLRVIMLVVLSSVYSITGFADDHNHASDSNTASTRRESSDITADSSLFLGQISFEEKQFKLRVPGEESPFVLQLGSGKAGFSTAMKLASKKSWIVVTGTKSKKNISVDSMTELHKGVIKFESGRFTLVVDGKKYKLALGTSHSLFSKAKRLADKGEQVGVQGELNGDVISVKAIFEIADGND